jgi:hypothetical protein
VVGARLAAATKAVAAVVTRDRELREKREREKRERGGRKISRQFKFPSVASTRLS